MEKNVKFILSILLIACMFFLISAVALFFMRQTEMEKRQLLENNLSQIKKEKVLLSGELEEAKKIKGEMETKLTEVQDRAKVIETQLNQEKKLRESLFSQLEVEKKESKRLVEELVVLKGEKESILSDLENINLECDTVKTHMYNIQQAKEVLEGKLKEFLARREVKLEKIVVKPEDEISGDYNDDDDDDGWPHDEPIRESTPTSTVGEILVINKKFDFVVVSLGQDDGLKTGMDLGVYRDKRLLAMLKVEKVQTHMAAAKIPSKWRKANIKEGDTVLLVQ
ncbi:MAG: hypothetical protein HQ547_01645 [Candidatus Omnitrophica bacterium]|nr:hypothetical protein [Candidatus Omnitrophota bacterium]